MAFDWRDFLALAKTLQAGLGGVTTEASTRSAVSRAYYAAFCHARNYAVSNLSFRAGQNVDDHMRIRSHLSGRGMLEVSRRLNQLRQWRNSCDYDDTVLNLGRIVGSAIHEAEAVLNRL